VPCWFSEFFVMHRVLLSPSSGKSALLVSEKM
jgi:hypothetical protein